jgi:hypothetical protein
VGVGFLAGALVEIAVVVTALAAEALRALICSAATLL